MQGIAGEAVAALQRELGSRPADLVAAIGPCLGLCCGEMGPEVVEMFRAAGHHEERLARWFQNGQSGRPYFDLWSANREQLETAGLRPDRIHTAGLCSRSHPAVFHSYRARGAAAGRMLGILRAR
jgi:copper oxidase (laccase) domain-containing protein